MKWYEFVNLCMYIEHLTAVYAHVKKIIVLT